MTQYSIKYVERDLSVDFIAHEVVGIGADGKRLFEVRGGEGDWIAGEPTEECEVFVSGTVKWDGCVNFDFPSVEDCMIHRCDRRGMESIGALLLEVYDECMRILSVKGRR